VLFDAEDSRGVFVVVVVELAGVEMGPVALVVIVALPAQGPLTTTVLAVCTEPVSRPATEVITPIAETTPVVGASTETSTAAASGTVDNAAQNEIYH
jgi:hypothetical protein